MKKLVLATAALLALASPASADTFLATSYAVFGGQNVSLLSPKAENVVAGEIRLTGPGGVLDVWCLDVFDGINLPYNYNVETFTSGSVYPGVNALSDGQVRQIAALMFLGDHLAGVNKAAIQLAIWKAEYTGTFASLASGSLLADQNTYFNGSLLGGIFDRADLSLTILSDAPINPSQAFGFVTVAAVPEASTWAMMILGFAGIVVMGARRRKQGDASFRLA